MDIICGRLLICISVFLLCGGLYLYSLRRCAGKIALALAVAFGVWSLVSIFRGLLLEELFAQLFVGGAVVGAELTMLVSALRPQKKEIAPIVEEFIDFGFDPEEEGDKIVDPMDQAVERWVATKRYLDSEVTIISMSAELKTNRTYLSNYINKHHGITFRDWLTALRIKEAKILLADPTISISEVATRTGFSTGTTFSRSFTRVEEISPTVWRERRG